MEQPQGYKEVDHKGYVSKTTYINHSLWTRLAMVWFENPLNLH